MQKDSDHTTSHKTSFEELWRLPDGAWVTPEITAAMLGCSKSLLAHWRCDGKGPDYRKRGKLIRYQITDVKAWLSEDTNTHK